LTQYEWRFKQLEKTATKTTSGWQILSGAKSAFRGIFCWIAIIERFVEGIFGVGFEI
jgi:hypothetical protein